MNFDAFQLWRQQCLRANSDLLDCGETNLYRALATLRPKPDAPNMDRAVHRCDLARAWLARCGFPARDSRHALVCRGVRHALALIFQELARSNTALWIPGDVYPVYLKLARAAGVEPRIFTTLPEPEIPANQPGGGVEYLLIANPWKPLGRYLADKEFLALLNWLDASPHRRLLMDCVYDFNTPFHVSTQMLQATGRAILLHSVTKGWLWPKTFGVALLGEQNLRLESAFRDDSPGQEQLDLAQKLLPIEANCPGRVATELQKRETHLFTSLPEPVRKSLLLHPGSQPPGCYFFPLKMQAEELLQRHGVVGIPASAFGADWEGSILTSLSAMFPIHPQFADAEVALPRSVNNLKIPV